MEKLQIGRDLRDGLQIHVRYNADGEEEPAPTLCDGILEGGAPRLHHLEIRQCIPSWISAPFNCALKTLKLSLPDVPGNPSDLEIILDTLQDLPLLQCFELTLDEGIRPFMTGKKTKGEQLESSWTTSRISCTGALRNYALGCCETLYYPHHLHLSLASTAHTSTRIAHRSWPAFSQK
ncbi:hypothetical protein CC2G_004907 [Coprinopsis cinerea AmutBmut pab1-1]|nr:hypothetical protein CC2G_004907 [Coprinopsis cinerea AmutBmut pab1-1]